MEEIITMAHGAGGESTRRLIESVFSTIFASPLLTSDDAAVLPEIHGKVAMTTDAFIISPPFFKGGDIGKLSICGTVNDLACMGAKPMYLTCSFIIEEGFAVSDIRKIAESMEKTAAEAGVSIVAGDTKVAPRGECGGVFITTTGLGEVLTDGIGCKNVCDGDVVIVTGDIGRHGCAVLLARGDFGIDADVESDCAPLWGMVNEMMAVAKIHAMRDATRGGVGTVLNEIAVESGVNININEKALPVNDAVRGVCGLLGLDPLYMACEGRMVVFVSKKDEPAVLDALKKHKYGKNAAVIGSITKTERPSVTVNTTAGGQRLLPPPGGELLPRIC